jgi:hypothetical protein
MKTLIDSVARWICLAVFLTLSVYAEAAPVDDSATASALILSELKHQANVIEALSQNDRSRALELLISRAQTDLTFLEDAVNEPDSSVDKAKLCEAVSSVEPKISRYIAEEPVKSRYVRESLARLKLWCASR